MPLYEYECKKCHHRFEKIQKFSDRHTRKCPECGGPVEQLVSAAAVRFKGSGWYVTDYAKKSSASSDSSKSGDSSKAGDSAKSADSSKKEGKARTDGSAKSETSSKPREKASERK